MERHLGKKIFTAVSVIVLALTMTIVMFPTETLAASKKYVKSVSVSKSKVSVEKGKKATVKATVKVKGKASKYVTASSSNKKVAKVSVGKPNSKGVSKITITGVKKGKATITVKSKAKNSKKKYISKKITVTVKDGKTPVPTKDPEPTATPTPTPTPVSVVVKATITGVEKYPGKWCCVDDQGKTIDVPCELTRKYVSFNPWPTTAGQIEYVMKNYDDPYIIAALFVPCIDNYTYDKSKLLEGRGEWATMLETMISGGNTLKVDTKLSNLQIQNINQRFGMGRVVLADGSAIAPYEFASRAYLKGAKHDNDYTPEGGLTDKTKWQIKVDTYPYCGALDNGLEEGRIALCLPRYGLSQEEEGTDAEINEHNERVIIGLFKNGSNVWNPVDYVLINKGKPTSATFRPYDPTASVMFTNNYVPPIRDIGL